MENYKQKYETAIKQAKKELEACGSLDCDTARQVFRLFPELQSIKNEKIKTNIIKLLRFVRDTHHQYFDECNEAIEWLKKYPIFNMPKIEFKVGDWVIFKCGTPESVYKVEKLENYEYTLEHFLGGSMPLPFGSQSLLRHWTIQDAKDGDVLAADGCYVIFKKINDLNIKCYCTYHYMNNPMLFVNSLQNKTAFYPATKEQRDFLFQKIKEAGYEWDSNKKELIKL